MKKKRKLLGLALVASSLALITSCDKDNDDNIDSAVPAAPTALRTSSITPNSAVVAWVSDATAFELQVGNNTYTVAATSHLLSGLTPGTVYTWSVRAKNGDNFSEWVNGSDFKTGYEPLPTPTALAVANVTQTGAGFSWTSSAATFELQVGSDTYTTTATSYTVNNLQPGRPYIWAVRAKSAETYSEWAFGDFQTLFDPSAQGAEITFGTYTWQATYSSVRTGYDEAEQKPFIYARIYKNTNAEGGVLLPILDFYIYGYDTPGTYSSADGLAPGSVYNVDYYHNTIVSMNEAGTSLRGDYWLVSSEPSSIVITEISKGGSMSGTISATLMDVFAYYDSGQVTINTVPLTATFIGLPVE